MTRPAATVFVVDDDAGVRELVRSLVASVGLGVETYASGPEFLDGYDGGWSGCLVLDVRMPGMSGLELQDELVQHKVAIPTIMISGFGDVPTAVRALKSGAIDFLEKPFSGQLLLDRIHRGIELDAAWRRAEKERQELEARVARLTRREREVMERVLAGKTNRLIAAELGLCEKTVEVHRSHVMVKMRVRSVAELVRLTSASRTPE